MNGRFRGAWAGGIYLMSDDALAHRTHTHTSTSTHTYTYTRSSRQTASSQPQLLLQGALQPRVSFVVRLSLLPLGVGVRVDLRHGGADAVDQSALTGQLQNRRGRWSGGR